MWIIVLGFAFGLWGEGVVFRGIELGFSVFCLLG